MKKVVATMAIGLGLVGGAVGLSSPAWAACGLGANAPTTGLLSVGSRTGCTGTVDLEVRFTKDVSLLPDPYTYTRYEGFGNGSLSKQGSCDDGHGSYYTWTVSSSGNSIESGRVTRC